MFPKPFPSLQTQNNAGTKSQASLSVTTAGPSIQQTGAQAAQVATATAFTQSEPLINLFNSDFSSKYFITK